MNKELIPVTSGKGTSYRCDHGRCASKGNRVTATHVHKYVPTPPMSYMDRIGAYERQLGLGPTVLGTPGQRCTPRQQRRIRKAALREVKP